MGSLGTLHSIHIENGSYLPDWHPYENYAKNYASKKTLGGGVTLTQIHELDYLYYKFGPIKNISYTKNKLTNITNDTEDLVIGRIEFKNGTIADFTLNYLSEKYQRYYDILEKGILKRVNLNLDNQMYINEIKYFVECVKLNTQGMNSFIEAHTLLKKLI